MVNHGPLRSLIELDDTPDAPLLRELVKMFGTQTPLHFTKMEKALKGQDPTTIFRAAHTLKSSASYLGATEMVELCKKIETWSTQEPLDLSQGQRLILELKKDYEITACELSGFLATLPPLSH